MQKTNKTRRKFISSSIICLGTLLLSNKINIAQNKNTTNKLNSDLVHDFVKFAHFDYEKVNSLLETEPGLLHSAWDWGGGDFETAIQASSHVGNKEITRFLLTKGARMNLFTAVMLGEIQIVKSILQIFPDQINSKGPHGLGLIHHAEKGGNEAEDVLIYLKQMGAE